MIFYDMFIQFNVSCTAITYKVNAKRQKFALGNQRTHVNYANYVMQIIFSTQPCLNRNGGKKCL